MVIRNQTYLAAEAVVTSPKADEYNEISKNIHPTEEQQESLPISSNIEIVDLPITHGPVPVQLETISCQSPRPHPKKAKTTSTTSRKSVEKLTDPPKDDQMPVHLKCRTRKAQADAQIRDFVNLVCDLCDSQPTFFTFKKLQEHFEGTHQTKGYIHCCDRKIYRKDRILNHITNHVNPDAFKYVELRTTA